MQKAFINSITKAKHQDDLSIVGVGKGAKKDLEDYGDTDKTVGKDETKF